MERRSPLEELGNDDDDDVVFLRESPLFCQPVQLQGKPPEGIGERCRLASVSMRLRSLIMCSKENCVV